MTDELKPCPNPWCGSPRPPFLVWDLYRRHVQCVCGVRGPSSDHRSLDGVPHDVLEAEAITAWNIRADLVTPLDDPRVKALMKKARAVVDRWDSPLWKDLPHTGESIADLRAALSALEENK